MRVCPMPKIVQCNVSLQCFHMLSLECPRILTLPSLKMSIQCVPTVLHVSIFCQCFLSVRPLSVSQQLVLILCPPSAACSYLVSPKCSLSLSSIPTVHLVSPSAACPYLVSQQCSLSISCVPTVCILSLYCNSTLQPVLILFQNYIMFPQ